jgi:hypothetical protein
LQPRVNRGPITWEVDLYVLDPHIQQASRRDKGSGRLLARRSSRDHGALLPGGRRLCPTLKARSLEIARDEFGELHDGRST